MQSRIGRDVAVANRAQRHHDVVQLLQNRLLVVRVDGDEYPVHGVVLVDVDVAQDLDAKAAAREKVRDADEAKRGETEALTHLAEPVVEQAELEHLLVADERRHGPREQRREEGWHAGEYLVQDDRDGVRVEEVAERDRDAVVEIPEPQPSHHGCEVEDREDALHHGQPDVIHPDVRGRDEREHGPGREEDVHETEVRVDLALVPPLQESRARERRPQAGEDEDREEAPEAARLLQEEPVPRSLTVALILHSPAVVIVLRHRLPNPIPPPSTTPDTPFPRERKGGRGFPR